MTHAPSGTTTTTLDEAGARAAVSRISWRILPLIAVGYVIAYIDRTNIGFAQLGMGEDLGIKAAAYGFAASIFFIAYFFFEVPSNLLLRRFGARAWLARIMATWGIITVITGFTTNVQMLYVMRFLLGVAEAGFFPGIIVYLTTWFRSGDRAVALGWLVLAQPISFIFGGLLGGLILDHTGWLGLPGWRWLFILTGVPAILMAVVTFVFLPNSPATARWLDPADRDWLNTSLESEQGTGHDEGVRAQLTALKNRRVLHLAATHLALAIGTYGFNLFLPLIIKQINPDYSATNIGFVAAIPYICAAIALLINARLSKRVRERKYLVAVPLALAAVGLAGVIALRDHPGPAVVALAVTGVGAFAWLPPFWSLTTDSISKTHVAVGIATINSIGNLGGFIGPYLVGKETDGSTVTAGLLIPVVSLVVSTVLILLWRSPARQPGAGTEPGAEPGAEPAPAAEAPATTR
ncbi:MULTISPECIES: MFS transporter [Streptomyces]|uniref:MFS transporter n=1 Tax=Streptomyces lonegramiae TaxID=3075524 RepID=A0ABU2XVG9_9ACTN|nr:MFS transporter [Streptomyces sp. DSM 41529]MDT0549921.1 MFS transporter [Streptomyces sp. DSM 41529]